MLNPSISPDGTKVLGGNGNLKYYNIIDGTINHVGFPGQGYLRGGWVDNDIILLQNEADTDLYLWRSGTATKYRIGKYGGNSLRVGAGLNYATCIYGERLEYNDIELGDKNYDIDLIGQLLVSNYNQEQSVRVWHNGIFIKDYAPLTPPFVVRASVTGHIGYGYFSKSAIINPDGTQRLVNLVSNETPGKIVVDKVGSYWIVTSDDKRTYLRPLGHTDKTAIILNSESNRLDIWSDGNKVIIACDKTDGTCSIFEANFNEALVPIETIPEHQMIIPAVTVDKWTLKNMEDGGEFIIHDRNNPTEGYKCRVYIQGGSLYGEMTNAKGTAKTGTFRPVEKCPVINPPNPTPLPPGPVTDATIVKNGKFFRRENGERMTVIESSEFSLFKRYLDHDPMYETVLNQRRALGFNTVRVWLMNKGVVAFRNGVEQDGIYPNQYPDFYSRLTALVDDLANRKFCVELTAFAVNIPLDMPNPTDQQHHLDATANAIRGRKNVIIELVNENDQHDNTVSTSLIRPTGVIISHGSNGADHRAVQPIWDYGLYHSNALSEFQRKVGHNAMEYANMDNVPYISNENTRYPEQDSSENHAYDAAAGGALLCAGSCFHSTAGKYSRPFDDTELRCAKQWIAGANSVPLEYQAGVYARHDELNSSTVIRAYSRTLSDGRRWLVKIRP